jgi:hypothetical protein
VVLRVAEEGIAVYIVIVFREASSEGWSHLCEICGRSREEESTYWNCVVMKKTGHKGNRLAFKLTMLLMKSDVHISEEWITQLLARETDSCSANLPGVDLLSCLTSSSLYILEPVEEAKVGDLIKFALPVAQDLEADICLPLASMPLNEKSQCFTVLRRPVGSLATSKIQSVLKFTVKEIDPSSGEAEEDGYEDEYQVGAERRGGGRS